MKDLNYKKIIDIVTWGVMGLYIICVLVYSFAPSLTLQSVITFVAPIILILLGVNSFFKKDYQAVTLFALVLLLLIGSQL